MIRFHDPQGRKGPSANPYLEACAAWSSSPLPSKWRQCVQCALLAVSLAGARARGTNHNHYHNLKPKILSRARGKTAHKTHSLLKRHRCAILGTALHATHNALSSSNSEPQKNGGRGIEAERHLLSWKVL